ncbi:Adenine phosphoribosyltransferase [Streptomyces hirsutus]
MRLLEEVFLAKRAQGTDTDDEPRAARVPDDDYENGPELDAAAAVVGHVPVRAPQPRARPTFRKAPMTELTDISTLLLSRIRDVAYYRPWVMFKDITPLLADPAAFAALSDALAEIAGRTGATKVVGLEARGFILGAPVAVRAVLGLDPRAQGGKLPGATLSQAYDLEYGSAEIEVHAEDLTAADRVLVIDDVLATGGTAEASVQLIRRAGADVAGLAVLMELGFLGGRARVEPALAGAPPEALLR